MYLRTILVKVGVNGRLPTRAYLNDAGFDLYASQTRFLPPNKMIKVELDIKIQLPMGTFGKIENRSSMGKKGVIIPSGVIDEGYRGPLSVLLMNLGEGELMINKGDRVAQMIIHPYGEDYKMIEWGGELSESERGERGFGSSNL